MKIPEFSKFAFSICETSVKLVREYLCNYYSNISERLFRGEFSKIPLKLGQVMRYTHCTQQQQNIA